MLENKISQVVIAAAIEVQRELGGPGLLEDVYEEALSRELSSSGLYIERQHVLAIRYKGLDLRKKLVLDLLVENLVVVEVKATERHNPIFEAQLLTCLRVSKKKLGLLLNFGQPYMAKEVKRVVNGLA